MESDGNFHKWANHLTVYWLGYLEIFTLCLWALVGIFFEKNWDDIGWLFFAINIILSLVVLYHRKEEKAVNLQLAKNIEDLSLKYQRNETELDEARLIICDMFKTQLAHLFKQLNLSGTERITVYRHDRDSFVPVARYSIHNSHGRYRRRRMSENEGFISKTWNSPNGVFFINGLHRLKVPQYFKAVMQQCNIQEQTLNTMRMKSVEYCGVCLQDSQQTQRIAVLMFESTVPGRLDVHKIREVLAGEQQRLTYFVETVEPGFNSFAEKKGF